MPPTIPVPPTPPELTPLPSILNSSGKKQWSNIEYLAIVAEQQHANAVALIAYQTACMAYVGQQMERLIAAANQAGEHAAKRAVNQATLAAPSQTWESV